MTSSFYKQALLPAFMLLYSLRPAAQAPATPESSPVPGEKIFVHTDRAFYVAGEICWCKLYCVDASSHSPIDLSKLAYIELLDRENKPVMQVKAPLEKGEGYASLFLPSTLNSGFYKLRAYTNWMKNDGPASFFEKTLTIVNTFKNLTPPATAGLPASPGPTARPSSYHIEFFPEGGNLVNGLPSKVAFQLMDANEKGAEGRGWVLDEKNDTLETFAPLQHGLGNFLFTPLEGHSYTAAVQLPDGVAIRQPLPTPLDQGYVCRFNDLHKQRLSVKVYISHGVPGGNVYLTIQKEQQPVGQTLTASVIGDSASFDIDKKDLGEGISRFILLDAGHRPVCERLYCIRPSRQLQIEAATDRRQYGIREKVRLSVTAGDKREHTAAPGLSIAVYRLDSLRQDPRDEMDILTYLWLGTELTGKIEAPGSYFYGDPPHAEEALDNLVLTHSRTNLSSSFPFPPERRGHIISGRVTDRVTGAPVKGVFTFLSAPGTQFQFAGSLTDTAGKFIFDIKDFYGTEGILIYTDTRDSNTYKIEIFNPFSELYNSDTLPPFRLSPDHNAALAQLSLDMQVRNIYTSDSLKKFTPPSRDSFRFYGPPDHTYLLDDYVRFSTMEEVLREYVDPINVDKWQGRLHVSMLNEPVHRFFEDNNNTLVLLDGIPVPDDKIFSYDPIKVKKLEIIPHQYILGPITFSGIASFTTYNGNYEGLEMDSRSLQIDYDGLQWQRKFYSPVYSTPQEAASRLPDFRDLLWWGQNIHLVGGEKKEYDFYTADLPGKYLVVIQGLTADGMAGAQYLQFEVK